MRPGTVELRDIASTTKATAPADFAGKNRSFAILKPADVTAAAKAIGRAGDDNYDAATLKRNITRIAKRKGAAFVAKLPKDWQNAGKAEKAASFAPFVGHVTLAAKDGDAPRRSWAQVLRTGEFYDPRYGDFAITRRDLATMVANFTSGRYPQGSTKLAVDYNHGTSHPSSAEEGKAAGWIANLELRADGDELWAEVEWTETAASLIDGKEYQFTSATFSFDYTNSNGGEEIGPTLMAFALTNRPVVHGMQPVTLALAHPAAVRLATDAETEDEAVEGLFSFDETRRRVQAALTALFGVMYGPADYYGSCRGIYLVDLFDDRCIYAEYDGGKFSVDYAIAADGTVSFTSEPIEVVIDYRPLTADAAGLEETAMSTMKVKDAKGNEIELAQDAIDAIVKTHAPKPAATGEIDLANHPVFKELQGKVSDQASTIQTLSAKNLALETEAKDKDARSRVEALVRDGRIAPADRDELVQLAIAEPSAFSAVEKQLAKRQKVANYQAGPVGSGADGNATSATQEVVALAKAEQDCEKTLSMADAMDRVFRKNPDLYARYAAETTVKV